MQNRTQSKAVRVSGGRAPFAGCPDRHAFGLRGTEVRRGLSRAGRPGRSPRPGRRERAGPRPAPPRELPIPEGRTILSFPPLAFLSRPADSRIARGESASLGGPTGSRRARRSLSIRSPSSPRQEPHPARDPRFEDHPEGDSLTVPHPEAAGRLEGVAEGVPEVEEHPRARFALVAGDDARLHRRRPADRPQHGARLAPQELAARPLEKAEQPAIRDDAALDRLGEPRAELPARAACRAWRCRRRPRAEGGTPPRGSCPAGGPPRPCPRSRRRASRSASWEPARTARRGARSRRGTPRDRPSRPRRARPRARPVRGRPLRAGPRGGPSFPGSCAAPPRETREGSPGPPGGGAP